MIAIRNACMNQTDICAVTMNDTLKHLQSVK